MEDKRELPIAVEDDLGEDDAVEDEGDDVTQQSDWVIHLSSMKMASR